MTTINKSDADIIAIINSLGEVVYRNSGFIQLFTKLTENNPVNSIQSTNENPQSSYMYPLDALLKKIDISIQKGIVTSYSFQESESGEVSYEFNCHPVINDDKNIECVILLGHTSKIAVAESSSDSIIFPTAFFHHFNCDNDLKIRSSATNTGVKIDSLKSRYISDILPENLVKIVSDKLKSIEYSHGFFQFQFDFIVADRNISADIKLLRNSDGITIILEDLTDQASKDTELRKYVEELHYSKIISEQYAKELSLVNKKLNESEEELKKINMDKDKFFSIVAHDLRSPFSSLLGFSDYLSKESGNLSTEEIQTYAKSIYTTGRHVLSLLENLLQWSRVQLGRIEFSPVEYNLAEQLNSLYEYFEHMAGGKNIKIILKASDKMIVYADKNMIETALRNLLSNSLKFTSDGGTIKLIAVKRKGNIEIRVEDNGVGMSKENQNKLFRIDSQHSTLGTRNEKGSGLGLLICKEFVEKNNGEILVESKLGKGTVFTIVIPQGKAPGSNSDSGKRNKVQKTSGYQFSK